MLFLNYIIISRRLYWNSTPKGLWCMHPWWSNTFPSWYPLPFGGLRNPCFDLWWSSIKFINICFSFFCCRCVKITISSLSMKDLRSLLTTALALWKVQRRYIKLPLYFFLLAQSLKYLWSKLCFLFFRRRSSSNNPPYCKGSSFLIHLIVYLLHSYVQVRIKEPHSDTKFTSMQAFTEMEGLRAQLRNMIELTQIENSSKKLQPDHKGEGNGYIIAQIMPWNFKFLHLHFPCLMHFLPWDPLLKWLFAILGQQAFDSWVYFDGFSS